MNPKEKKSWLYKGTLTATILTLIGIWSHLATAFSIYEIKDPGSGLFDWSFSGMVLASAISMFLIFTAIGITKLERRAEEAKGKSSKMIIANHKMLNRFLIFFAVIEMYGNVYYSIAAHLKNPVFRFDQMVEIDPVAATSIVMFSFTLTIISIVGSKLLSIFAVNDEPEIITKIEKNVIKKKPNVEIKFAEEEPEEIKKAEKTEPVFPEEKEKEQKPERKHEEPGRVLPFRS